jgi:hypothetical protein
MPSSNSVGLLLRTAFQHLVTEANAEAGVARVQELIGQAFPGEIPSERTLHDALATCLRDGLIHEPVRLPPGALQCHWRLELTPKGVAAGRALDCDAARPVPGPTTPTTGADPCPAVPTSTRS